MTCTHLMVSETCAHRLPDARLQEQVAAALEPDARLEERLERVALAAEAVDDLGAWKEYEQRFTRKGWESAQE